MWRWVERAMAKVTPSTISACHPLRNFFGYQPISGSNKSLVARLCHDTDGGATGVRSGLPQIPFLPLVKHSSKELHFFWTLARVPERSKYCTAICRPDAMWSAAAGRPTSPRLNRDSSPVRFSAVSNGHFGVFVCFNLRVLIKESQEQQK